MRVRRVVTLSLCGRCADRTPYRRKDGPVCKYQQWIVVGWLGRRSLRDLGCDESWPRIKWAWRRKSEQSVENIWDLFWGSFGFFGILWDSLGFHQCNPTRPTRLEWEKTVFARLGPSTKLVRELGGIGAELERN